MTPKVHLALISRGTTVLCEFSEIALSNSTFTLALLGKIPHQKDQEVRIMFLYV